MKEFPDLLIVIGAISIFVGFFGCFAAYYNEIIMQFIVNQIE